MPCVEQELVIANELGLHARPAAMFVDVAQQYEAEVLVSRDGEEVNGKSPIGLLMLCAGNGAKLQLKISGEDAREALQALTRLVNSKFGEE